MPAACVQRRCVGCARIVKQGASAADCHRNNSVRFNFPVTNRATTLSQQYNAPAAVAHRSATVRVWRLRVVGGEHTSLHRAPATRAARNAGLIKLCPVPPSNTANREKVSSRTDV